MASVASTPWTSGPAHSFGDSVDDRRQFQHLLHDVQRKTRVLDLHSRCIVGGLLRLDWTP
jgi:hypothetical protein